MKETSKRRKKSSSSDQSGESQAPCTSQQLLETLGQGARQPQGRLYKPSKKSARPEPEWTGEPSTSVTGTLLDYYTPTSFKSLYKQEEIGSSLADQDPFALSELLDPDDSHSILQHYIPTTTYVAHQLSNIALYQPSTSFPTNYGHGTDLERPTVTASTSQVSEPLPQSYYDTDLPSTSYSSQQGIIGAPATPLIDEEYPSFSTTPGCSKDIWQDVTWSEDVESFIDDPFHQTYDDVNSDSETKPPKLVARVTSRLVLRNRIPGENLGNFTKEQQETRLAVQSTLPTFVLSKKDAPPILKAEAPTCSTYEKASQELSVNLPSDFIDIEEEEGEPQKSRDEPTPADNFLKGFSTNVDKSQPLGVDLERLFQSAKQKGMQFLRRGLKKGKGPGAQVKAHLKECIFIEKNRRLQKLAPIETLFEVNPFKDVTQKNIFSYLAKKYPWMPKSDRPKQESTIDNLLKQEELVSRVLEAVRMKITPAMRFRMNHVLNNVAGYLANLKDYDTPEQMLEEQIIKEERFRKSEKASVKRGLFLAITADDNSATNMSLSTVVLIYWFTNQLEQKQSETPSSSHQFRPNFEVDLANKEIDMKYFESNPDAASYVANQFLNHRVVLHLLARQTELDAIAIQAQNDGTIKNTEKESARKRIQESLRVIEKTKREKEQEIRDEEKALEKEEWILQVEHEKTQKKNRKEQEKFLKQLEKERIKEEKKALDEEHRSYVKRMQGEKRQTAKESKKRSGGKGPESG